MDMEKPPFNDYRSKGDLRCPRKIRSQGRSVYGLERASLGYWGYFGLVHEVLSAGVLRPSERLQVQVMSCQIGGAFGLAGSLLDAAASRPPTEQPNDIFRRTWTTVVSR